MSLVMLMSLSIVAVHADTNEVPNYLDVDDDGDTILTTTTSANVNIEAEVSSRLIRDVSSQRGAQVRVMQLMRNIETNIEGAELIIQRLRDSGNENVNYDKLYEIVSSLDVIVVELEEFDYSKSAQEMAKEFTVHRQDAMELTAEFRAIVSASFSDEEKEEIRTRIQEVKEDQREEFRTRIENQKKDHQIEQFRELVVRLDIQAGELVQLVVAGEVSVADARQRLALMLRDRNQQEREEAVQRVREIATRENIEVQQRVQEIQEVVRERAQQRNERLEESLVQRQEKVEARITARVDKATPKIIQDISNRVEYSDEELEEAQRRVQEVRNERLNVLNTRIEKVQDRLQNIRDNNQNNQERPQACTREYAPVCAQPPMPECPEGMACAQVMPPLQTFGNECMARAAGAEIQYRGECRGDNSQQESSTGGGAGRVSIATFEVQTSSGQGAGKVSLLVDRNNFLQIEGDQSIVSSAEMFLKFGSIESDSRAEVVIDNDGFLVVDTQNLEARTDAFLKIEGVEGEVLVIVHPRTSRGDDRPSESVSLSFGKVEVVYSQQSTQDDVQESCQRVQSRTGDNVLWCWGAAAKAVMAQDYNSSRSNRIKSEVEDGDEDSSTQVRVEADVTTR